jgi:transporter family protein
MVEYVVERPLQRIPVANPPKATALFRPKPCFSHSQSATNIDKLAAFAAGFLFLAYVGNGFFHILSPPPMWIPYALLSAFFAALTALFAKIGIKGVDSDLATAIRTVIILLLAWGIAIARGATAGLPALSQRTWLFLALSGLATGASWLCYFRALKLGPVSKVAPVDKLSVALSLLLAVVFLGETISVKGALGAGLILAGTIVLVWA